MWPIQSITGNTIVVSGDCTAEKLYIGFRISAEREDGTFYLKGQNGLIPTRNLTVGTYEVSYAATGYFRAQVTYKNQPDNPKIYQMSGRVFGDVANTMDRYPITEGTFPVPVGALNTEFRVRLINDSFLPSRWTSAQYYYEAAFLAQPQTGLGTQRGRSS
jgi:hypothetical protein